MTDSEFQNLKQKDKNTKVTEKEEIYTGWKKRRICRTYAFWYQYVVSHVYLDSAYVEIAGDIKCSWTVICRCEPVKKNKKNGLFF